METQETNYESIPIIEAKRTVFSEDDTVCDQIERRIICGRLGKATFVKTEDEVSHAVGNLYSSTKENWTNYSATR